MSSETGTFERWLDQTSDRLNPLLVRETRQWVKSSYFMVSFLLLVGLCWFAAAFEIAVPRAFTGLFFDGPPAMLRPDGRSLFALYYVVLTLSVFLVVPVTAFVGFTREYHEEAIEVLRTTPLSAAKIAWGKLQTALLQMLLYFSAVAPFICLTYLLQGVGLVVVFSALTQIAVGGTALALLGLALGSFARSPGWQAFNLVLLLAGIVLALLLFLAIGLGFSRTPDLGNLIGGAVCSLVISSFVSMTGLAVTINNIRPLPLVRILFIDLLRLKAISSHARALATILRADFPIAGIERHWTPERTEAFPKKFEQAINLALTLERIVNVFPLYADRQRYVTYEAARAPLRELLTAFDELIVEVGWKGLPSPTRCRMHSDGTPPVRDLTLGRINLLEESAARIETACLEIAEHLSQPSGKPRPISQRASGPESSRAG